MAIAGTIQYDAEGAVVHPEGFEWRALVERPYHVSDFSFTVDPGRYHACRFRRRSLADLRADSDAFQRQLAAIGGEVVHVRSEEYLGEYYGYFVYVVHASDRPGTRG